VVVLYSSQFYARQSELEELASSAAAFTVNCKEMYW
jgi:hypothetical protein